MILVNERYSQHLYRQYDTGERVLFPTFSHGNNKNEINEKPWKIARNERRVIKQNLSYNKEVR